MKIVFESQASCPKCRTPRDPESTLACKKCGLAADRMAGFAEKRDANVPASLQTQWAKTLASWEDPASHDELLRLVTQLDAFAWLAARYREIVHERPTDAVAAKQLERLRRAAEMTLMATATRRAAEKDATPGAYRSAKLVLAVLVVCLIALVIYAWLTSRKPPVDPTLVPPVPAESR